MKQKFENLGSVLSKGDAKRIFGSTGCVDDCIANTSQCSYYHYCDSFGGCDKNPVFCCNIYCNSEQPG
ncbi:MAG: hypothetical protein IKD55_11050 [Sediminibacterium sp.]|nr:hypothetical protein [Sediminibacterium sp.]